MERLGSHKALYDHDCKTILDRLVQHLDLPQAERFLVATQGWTREKARQYVKDYTFENYTRLKCRLIDGAMHFLSEYKHIVAEKGDLK